MQKLGFSVLCVLLLTFTSTTALTQQENTQQSTSSEWLSILSQLVSNEYVQSRLGKIGTLLHFGNGIQPSPAHCQVCTMLLGTTMNYCQLHNKTIDQFLMKELCPMFPVTMRIPCQQFINTFGATIIASIVKYASADVACREIKICTQKECNLYPKKFHENVTVSSNWTPDMKVDTDALFAKLPNLNLVKNLTSLKSSFFGRLVSGKATVEELDAIIGFIERHEKVGEKESPFDWIKKLIDMFTGNHTTPIDLDGDRHSNLSPSIRGYNWRGRDCNDADAKIYPGRKSDPHPARALDYNCNGIKGKNPATGKEYKDEFCANSQQMGVVVMGDSAGAHAEIPVSWVNASMWDDNTFANFVEVLLNEVDLPHMSGYTGYMETGVTGPVSSVYKYLHQRNKCNFRDYHNIAVNGASSKNCFEDISRLGRNSSTDHPVLIFLELIGNDVCNHRKTFDAMTTPAEFRKNMIKIFDYIDSVVPAGSHLFVLGVANGSLIYEGVAGREHPVGVTFDRVYDYQNCIESSFCWGWLNTDKSIRDATTKRADELNDVYRDLVKTYKPKNYDFVYYDFPAAEIFNGYKNGGGDPIDLIELVDGFHPSQLFHAKLGDWLWDTLKANHPSWIGPENPNNDMITKLFGNQGGY